MKTGTTGAPVRREITASPLDVEAGTPKKGTNTPSARELFWSRRTPTIRAPRRASRSSRNPPPRAGPFLAGGPAPPPPPREGSKPPPHPPLLRDEPAPPAPPQALGEP